MWIAPLETHEMTNGQLVSVMCRVNQNKDVHASRVSIHIVFACFEVLRTETPKFDKTSSIAEITF